ncbi:hypothetical protein RRG08_038701 [Elysia crispata]|uniref:Uncharacterized protein n=1 Tax=Elysia crispata TaxID=231223 RepID=A0AAE1DHP3_9GAST|nr:hypothetical protein RRG08_038701 [Elysia crispata]
MEVGFSEVAPVPSWYKVRNQIFKLVKLTDNTRHRTKKLCYTREVMVDKDRPILLVPRQLYTPKVAGPDLQTNCRFIAAS